MRDDEVEVVQQLAVHLVRRGERILDAVGLKFQDVLTPETDDDGRPRSDAA